MATLPTLQDEVRQLRDRISQLENDALRQRDRTPTMTFPKHVRPAMTWRDSAEDYPAQTEKNTLPIVFCNFGFSDFTKRSATHDVFARWPKGYWLPRATPVLVMEDNDRYLIIEAFFDIHRIVTATSDMVSGEIDFLLDDLDETTVKASNTAGMWDNAATGMQMYVACLEGTWQVLDVYDCDAVTGAGA